MNPADLDLIEWVDDVPYLGTVDTPEHYDPRHWHYETEGDTE